MAKELTYTSQFKKDLKRYKHQTATLQELKIVLTYLADGKTIPANYKPHLHHGNYNGFMECHVENDTLLIWLDENTNIIKLIRFDSHSELF